MKTTKNAPSTANNNTSHLCLTDDPEACNLLAEDGNAFLIGFILDQQVTVQKAFKGPFDLRDRIGSIDAQFIADFDPALLEQAFGEKPALHRFPSAMAKRVQKAMQIVVESYEGNAANIWWTAEDLPELERRLLQIPGFAQGKINSVVAVLATQCKVPVTGWEDRVPEWGTLGDVDSPEALKKYQTTKRAYKARLRAAK